MNWLQDGSDFSWYGVDEEGCQFRIAQALCPDHATWVWACAWEETKGPRIGSNTYASAEEAKAAMESIATLKVPQS
jgi:hypothetical protein